MSDISNPPPREPADGDPAPARPRPTLGADDVSAGPPPPIAEPGVQPAETEYTSTIVAPSQIAVSIAIGVVLAVILVGIRTSLWPLAIVVFVALSAAGVYLAGVTVIATRTYLEIGQGRNERNPRYIPKDEIATMTIEQLSWEQVFGVGLPRREKGVTTTRLTVRPGPTLVVQLHTGDLIRVSTPEPERVIALLGRA